MAATVGIMSMQRIYNYGSSLQAYGLRRLIEGACSRRARLVRRLRPGRLLVEPAAGAGRSRLRHQRAVSKVGRVQRRSTRLSDKLRFFNHKRSYGKRYFPMIGVPPQPNRDLDVDVQVIGSDEVFNCVQSNTNVGYSRDLFGHGSPAQAADLVRRLVRQHDAGEDRCRRDSRRISREDFRGFASISVRDRNSAGIVERSRGSAPSSTSTRSLAYDFMRLETEGSFRAPTRREVHHRVRLLGRLDHDENEILRAYARSIGARSCASAASRNAATDSSTATRSSCSPTSATPRRSSPTRSTARSCR